MAACDVPGHLRRIQCCTISVVNLPDAGNGFLRLFVIIIVGGAPSILRAAFNLRMIQQVDVIVEDVLEPSVFIHQLSGVGSAIRCSLDDEICGAVIAIQSSGYLLTIGWVGKCWPENCVDVVSQLCITHIRPTNIQIYSKNYQLISATYLCVLLERLLQLYIQFVLSHHLEMPCLNLYY